MALRRIDLDYRPPSRHAGRALLGLGIATLLVTAVAWLDMANEVRTWERAAAATQPRTARATDTGPDLTRQLEQANEVIERLALPWDALFHAIEQAAGSRVALLGVEPDAARARVTLRGEAGTYAELLQYMTRLDAGPILSQPRLLDHEEHGEGDVRPVAFTISAQWRTAP